MNVPHKNSGFLGGRTVFQNPSSIFTRKYKMNETPACRMTSEVSKAPTKPAKKSKKDHLSVFSFFFWNLSLTRLW
jgi:hypothetical protein